MIFLSSHRLALLLAVFIGACMGFSYASVPLSLGDEYRGIMPMYYDDGNVYRARMQEILDGHPAVASSFLHEYKQEPANVAPVGEWLYAIPAFIFGISTVQWAYFFLLPAVLFLLVYFFTRKLLGEETRDAELTALAAGSLVLFGFEFVDYHYVISLLQGGPPAAFVWTRPVNPIIGGLQLFGTLLLLWEIIDGKRGFIIPAGVLVASMVGYYFAWGIGLAILGSLFILLFARKRFSAARDIFYVGIISVLCVSPYVYSALTAFGGEGGVRASMRTGMFFTHEPVVNTVLLFTTLIFSGLFLYMWNNDALREHGKSWLFIAGLLIAGWVAFNEQVLTGRSIWHHHFVQYTVPFAYIALLVTGYLSLREILPRFWRIGVATIIVITCVHGLYTAAMLHKEDIESFRVQQSYAPFTKWLRDRGGEVCVVFPTDNHMSKIVSAYTQCDVYVSDAAFYAVPPSRILHNYLLTIRLKGVSFEDVTKYFLNSEAEVRNIMFDDWHQLFGRGADDWFLKKTQDLTIAYALFLQEPLESQLRKFRVDFFVSREPILESVRAELPSLEAPQMVGDFYLYEFK